nr:transposase [Halorhodospira abdelmalekii]
MDNKLHWRGCWFIAVAPQNTCRTCPCCGHVSAENRETQARFQCVECGFEENADVVGAINVLRAEHARFACEVSDAVSGRGGCQDTQSQSPRWTRPRSATVVVEPDPRPLDPYLHRPGG